MGIIKNIRVKILEKRIRGIEYWQRSFIEILPNVAFRLGKYRNKLIKLRGIKK
jgi:hypothetical protein